MRSQIVIIEKIPTCALGKEGKNQKCFYQGVNFFKVLPTVTGSCTPLTTLIKYLLKSTREVLIG